MDFEILVWLKEALAIHPIAGAVVLALVCCLSATILPLPSEAFLASYLGLFPSYKGLAWLSATIGNTAGGAIGFGMGYALREMMKKRRLNDMKRSQQHLNDEKIKSPAQEKFWRSIRIMTVKGRSPMRKYGNICLIFSWVPIIGDILCVSAGYFQFNFFSSVIYMMIGKAIRYAGVIGLSDWAFSIFS